jgi:hypothetical protein
MTVIDDIRATSGGSKIEDVGHMPFMVLDADVTEIADSTPDSLRRESRFRFLTASQISERSQVHWLIDGILVQGTTAVLVGMHATYKTFVALDMALSVASGVTWHGREVTQGQVAYVLAEGAEGLGSRVLAWETYHEREVPNCHFLSQAVQLADSHDVDDLLKALELLEETPRLVVFDTLARCFVGKEENSAKDVGAFVAGIERVSVTTGATVLVVHHCGKQGDLRGSSALPAAVTTQIDVTKPRGGLVLSCGKQKHAADFEPIALRPDIVHLDDCNSSLVLADSHDFPSEAKALRSNATPHFTARDVQILDVLGCFGSRGASFNMWKKACADAGIPESTFGKRRTYLDNAGFLEKEGSMYRVARPEGRQLTVEEYS